MIKLKSASGYTKILKGIAIKTLNHGEAMLMSEFRLSKGADLPEHSHPQEQCGYLLSGRIILKVGTESRELTAGSNWSIPADLTHSAQILEDSVAIEVFSPLREDYLQYESAGNII